MLGVFNNFLYGCKCSANGILTFIRRPKYWLYAAFPIIICLIIYVIFGWLCYWAADGVNNYFLTLVDGFSQSVSSSGFWVSFLQKVVICVKPVIAFLVWGTFIVLGLGLCLLSFEVFYDIFGCIFFDKLAEVYYKDTYHGQLAKISLKDNIKFTGGSVVNSIKHLFLGLLILLISFIPFIGWLFLIPYKGYRIAQAALYSSYAIMGINFTIARNTLRHNKVVLFGFGLVGFIFMLIPFAIVFVLPGLVIGGVDLYISYLEGKEVSE